METVKIASLVIDDQKLIKSIQNTKRGIAEIKAENKKLALSGEETSEAFIRNEVALKSLNSELNVQKKTLGIVTDGQLKLKEGIDKEIKSVDDAIKNNKQLRLIRNQVNTSTAEGKKAVEDINKKIDQNTEFVNNNGSALEKQKNNIGNYKSDIKDAANELNVFNGGIVGFIARSQQAGGVLPLVGKGLKGITKGVLGMTRASLSFIATPVGAVIAAIAIPIGLLVNYLKNTQAGINAVNKVLVPMRVIFESLIGVFQVAGEKLFDAFSNPKKTLEDLGNFVKTNLINRFKAFGVILDGIINLDFKKISNGVLQAGTGIENLTDKVKNISKETGAFLSDAIARGQRLADLQAQYSKGEAEYIKNIGAAKEQFKALNLIAEDTTKTIAERETAAKASIQVAKDINKLNDDRLKQEIEILELKQSSNDTSDEERAELAKLVAARNEANASALEAITTQNNKVNTIAREREAQAKKAEEQRAKRAEDNINDLDLELELYKAQNKGKLESDVQTLEAIKNKELAINEERLANRLISEKEAQLERLNIENEFNDGKKTIENAELENIKDFEERKQALKDEIALAQAETDAEREQLKLEQDFEKQVLELETLALNETQKTELLLALKEQRELAIGEIEAKAAEERAAKEKKISDDQVKAESVRQKARVNQFKTVEGILSGILGESAAAKVASIAFETALSVAQIKIDAAKANASITANTAIANAKAAAASPLTAGLPFTAVNTAAGVKNIASTNLSAGLGIAKVIASGAIKAAKGFATGGRVGSPIIPINRANGDDQLATLKTGEVVLNQTQQNALGGNNTFKAIGVPGFASGGQVGGFNGSVSAPSSIIDYDLLAAKISSSNASLPSPVVQVSDISTAQATVSVIESGAEF